MELSELIFEYRSLAKDFVISRRNGRRIQRDLLETEEAVKLRLSADVESVVRAANKKLPAKLAITHYQVEVDYSSMAAENRPTLFTKIDGIGRKPYVCRDKSDLITPPKRIQRAFEPLIRTYHQHGLSLVVWMRNTQVPEQSFSYPLAG